MSESDFLCTADRETLESVEQFASMWKVFVGDWDRERGKACVADQPGLAIRWADCAFPFWNGIFLTDRRVDEALLTRRLGDAAAQMRRKRQLGYFWVCEEHLEEGARASLPTVLALHGLELALTARGMAGDFLPPLAPAHPALSFRRVTTEEELRHFADVNARAYGMPLEAARSGLEGSALWKGAMQSYVGYENGLPVSAAATVANDCCLFLALVATVPEAQRKGYGEATVRKALYEGARATGLGRTVLHATDAGFPVYRRVGYRPVATIHAYQLARCASCPASADTPAIA